MPSMSVSARKQQLLEKFRKDPEAFLNEIGLNTEFQLSSDDDKNQYKDRYMTKLMADRALLIQWAQTSSLSADRLFGALSLIVTDSAAYLGWLGDQGKVFSDPQQRNMMNLCARLQRQVNTVMDSVDPRRDTMADEQADYMLDMMGKRASDAPKEYVGVIRQMKKIADLEKAIKAKKQTAIPFGS